MAIGYEYKTDIDTSSIFRDITTKGLPLVGKTNHEIINIPQRLPSKLKIEIKLQLAPANFIVLRVVALTPDVNLMTPST